MFLYAFDYKKGRKTAWLRVLEVAFWMLKKGEQIVWSWATVFRRGRFGISFHEEKYFFS